MDANAPTSLSIDDLKKGLHTLPQELIDIIHDLTFTANPGQCHINSTYTPASTLQVSRSTREHFAHSYYPHTIFHAGTTDCINWISSLTVAHFNLITEIRLTQAQGSFKANRDSTGPKDVAHILLNLPKRLRIELSFRAMLRVFRVEGVQAVE